MSVLLTSSYLKTFDSEDTELDSVSQTGAATLTGALNMITERKRLYMEFAVQEIADPDTETQLELYNSSIYFNLALFMPAGFAYTEPSGAPAVGWSYLIPAAPMGAAAEMFFYGATLNCKNYRAWFQLLTETTYSIEIEFYQTYDENTYLNSTSKNNQYRFLSEFWNELNYNTIANSVFQVEKQIRLMTYVKHGLESTEPTYWEKFEKTIYQGQSQHFDTEVTLLNSDDESVAALSTVYSNSLKLYIPAAADDYDDFYIKLIRIRNDESKDFIDNYDLFEIVVDPVDVTYDPDNNRYVVDFAIDPENLEQGGNYRMAGFAYGGGGAISGVSEIVPTTNIVDYCHMVCDEAYGVDNAPQFSGSISDIDNTYSGNELTVCIEERLKTSLIVDYSDDRWFNNLVCRGWCASGCSRNPPPADNDIRKYLKSVTCEIYTEYTDANLGLVKNILDIQTVTRTALNTYSSSSSNLIFSFVAEILSLSYSFRVRNEENIVALSTTANGAPYFPIQDTQYWGGAANGTKDLFIKWRLEFYYYDWSTPFTDLVSYLQKLHVRGYNDHLLFSDLPDTVCSGSTQCFTVNTDLMTPETYKQINTIEPLPKTGVITEDEPTAPDLLPQLTDSSLTGQDPDFTAGSANFCVDSDELSLVNANSQGTYDFKVVSMSKKIK
jgi:hypothetical protein